MNISKRVLLVFILLILSIGAGYYSFKYSQTKVKADKLLDQDVDPKILKEVYDMNVKPCYDTPVNNKEQVIALAAKNGIRTKGVKIHTQYCLATFREPEAKTNEMTARKDPVLEYRHVYEGRPMWIISYRYKKHGGGKPLQMEFITVLDDISGVLMGSSCAHEVL